MDLVRGHVQQQLPRADNPPLHCGNQQQPPPRPNNGKHFMLPELTAICHGEGQDEINAAPCQDGCMQHLSQTVQAVVQILVTDCGNGDGGHRILTIGRASKLHRCFWVF